MENRLKERLNKGFLYFDGGMGTALQARGLQLGELPELVNFTHADLVEEIHKEYVQAGSQCITTNTFGANRYKLSVTPYSVESVITQAVNLARKAIGDAKEHFVILDIGSTGKLLEPLGDISFEEIYDVFKEQAIAGEKAGCDGILLETFTDVYELKAAILAVKENTTKPVFCTMSFEQNGRTFLGTSIESMVLILEGLGVDALGINCSLGPVELEPLVEKLIKCASIPVMLQPNAGLPKLVEGKNVYDVSPEVFSKYMVQFAQQGAGILGGCCGTTPAHIKAMIDAIKTIDYKPIEPKNLCGICSASQAVYFDDVRVIGERLNPTGKKLLKAALKEKNMDYILSQAIAQKEENADILDINVGLPDIDEAKMLQDVVKEVQAIVTLPLQIDSSDPKAIERAVRICNGKPMINSVNAKKESLEAILPIAKKYGTGIIGLALDEKGIRETAAERLEVARKIVEAAEAYGIAKENIFIDCLVLTASTGQELVQETLKSVALVKKELGVHTVLGVSNVSFGLPNRSLLNRTMLSLALFNGLDAPIMNPADREMMEVIAAYRVLMNRDVDCKDFIARFVGENQQDSKKETQVTNKGSLGLEELFTEAIKKGMKEDVKAYTLELIKEKDMLKIVEELVIPALDQVGKAYEVGKCFLPQLIRSAEAAQSAFAIIKKVTLEKQALEGNQIEVSTAKTKVILATVYGDIHDIGKNIVKLLMENYGFEVLDLGKDVPAEKIVESAEKNQIQIIGLSALMTTTVVSMEETIVKLKQQCPNCKVIVGGAVLTEDLAQKIGADYYAKDAMETVKIVNYITNGE